MVVLPAPVGPTIATFCPGSTTVEKSLIMVRSGVYPKCTWSNTTLPFGLMQVAVSTPFGSCCTVIGFFVSGTSSYCSKKLNTRSAAAAVCCKIFEILAI